MPATYDKIGGTYSKQRRPDPRIAAMIADAVGRVNTAVNVGAGTGSYEPPTVDVVAVEPSAVMVAQRRLDAAPAVQATAESLPFGDRSFDVALAVLTIHHWSNQRRGLEECARVARQRVVRKRAAMNTASSAAGQTALNDCARRPAFEFV